MPTSAPPKNHFERRRAETRQALVRAARQILAETGDTSASIQAIAERADVGFGSFYNHFKSKTELFDAAVTDALDEFGQAIDERVEGIEDPAELVAAGFRLTARMADSTLNSCGSCRGPRAGLHPLRARTRPASPARPGERHRLGPLHLPQRDHRPVSPGQHLMSLVALRLAHPDLDGDEAASDLAEMVLRMLGVPPDNTHQVTRRPLPGLG